MVDYRVVFEYKGKEPYAPFKQNVEKLFVVGYNMYCDESNKHIAKYNSECGDLLGDAYDEYMCKRLSEDAETVFNRFTSINALAMRAFTKFVVEPPCVFKAILRDGTKMYFYLKEI